MIPFYDKDNVEYQYDQEEFPRINPAILDQKFPELCNNPQSTKIIIEPDNIVSSINSNNTTEIYDEGAGDWTPEFCMDHGFNQSRSLGTVAVSCELPNDIFCKDPSNVCINFCCPEGQYENPEFGICQDYQFDKDGSATWWTPGILKNSRSNSRSIFSYPDCNQTFSKSNLNDSIEILSDGSIRLGGSLEGSVYDWNSYCLSHVESFNENSELIYYQDFQICTGSSISRNELVEWEEMVTLKVIPTLQLVSIVSLAILFVFLYQTKNHCLFG